MTTAIVKDGNRYLVTYWETIVFEREQSGKIILRTEERVEKVSMTTVKKINRAFDTLDLPFEAFTTKGIFYVLDLNTGELHKDERDDYRISNILFTMEMWK